MLFEAPQVNFVDRAMLFEQAREYKNGLQGGMLARAGRYARTSKRARAGKNGLQGGMLARAGRFCRQGHAFRGLAGASV